MIGSHHDEQMLEVQMFGELQMLINLQQLMQILQQQIELK
jgi:hypothetical protein